MNFCIGCGKNFSSVHMFDKHRVGEFGVNRRCLNDAELEELGYIEKDGVYGIPLTAEQRERLEKIWKS